MRGLIGSVTPAAVGGREGCQGIKMKRRVDHRCETPQSDT